MSVDTKAAAPMPRKRRAQPNIDSTESLLPSPKRRRVTKNSPSSKRRTKPTTIVEGDTDSQGNELFVVEAIQAERKRGRGTQYLIKWDGVNPDTGVRWSDSWEPAANANQEAIDAWEESKQQHSRPKKTLDSTKDNPASSEPTRSSRASSARKLVSKRSKRRVIDSDEEGEAVSDEEEGLFVNPGGDPSVRVDESRFTPAPSEHQDDVLAVAVPHVTHPSQYQFVGASQVTLPDAHSVQGVTLTQSTSQSHNEPSPPSSPHAKDSPERQTQANEATGPVIPDSQTITISNSPTTGEVNESDSTDRRDFGASEESGASSSELLASPSRVPLSSNFEQQESTSKDDAADRLNEQPASSRASPAQSSPALGEDLPRASVDAQRLGPKSTASLKGASLGSSNAFAQEASTSEDQPSTSTQQYAVEPSPARSPAEVIEPPVRPSQASTASEIQYPETLQSQIPYDPSTQLLDTQPARVQTATPPLNRASTAARNNNNNSSVRARESRSVSISRPFDSLSQPIPGTSRGTPLKERASRSQPPTSDKSTLAAFSSLARAPSRQASVTPDRRLPARPQTPSSAGMSSRPSTPSVRSIHGATFGRKLQELWKDRGCASAQGTPSKPASVETSPAPGIAIPARRLSSTTKGATPQSPVASTGQSLPASQMPPTPSAKGSNDDFDAHNYFCFLPLDEESKDIYCTVCASWDPSTSDQEATEVKGQQLLDICDHVDLLQGDVQGTQATQAMGPETQVDWSVATSSKFAFLQALIDDASKVSTHIALFVKPRLLNLVEAFLKGSSVQCKRPDRLSESVQYPSGIRVTLMTTSVGTADLIVDRPDLIIAFDSSFSHNGPEIKAARRQVQTKAICPCINLIVPYSLEHVIRLGRNGPGNPEHRDIADDVSLAKRLVDRVGHTANANEEHDNQPSPRVSPIAGRVARQLARGRDASWDECLPKLGSLPDLPGLDARESPLVNQKKRVPDAPLERPPTKRPRADAPAIDLTSTSAEVATASKDLDVTPRMLGSSAQSVSPSAVSADGPLIEDVSAAQPVLPLSPHETAQPELQPLLQSSIFSSNRAPPNPPPGPPSPDADALHAEIHRLKQHIAGLESGLSVAQSRYESRKASLETAVNSLTARDAEVASLQGRLETATNNITNLRTQRCALQSELDTLRASARTGELGPPAQEFEELRAKARRVDTLEKQLESSKTESDYFRTQYQSASSEAAARAGEISDLQTTLTITQQKASAETARLAQMRQLKLKRQDSQDVEKWKAEAAQLHRDLQRLSAAKKAAEDGLETERRRRGMAATTRSAIFPRGEVLAGRVVGLGGGALKSVGGGGMKVGAAGGAGNVKKRLGGLLDVGGAGVGARNGNRGATVSANTSRAVSPASGVQTHAKTSPLQRTVAMNE